MSVDASVQDFEATDEIGLACWHGDEDSPGYRASLNPEGHHWYMVKEPGQGAAIENVPATESGSQIPVPAEGEVLHIRVDCLASPSETTLRLFLNGALVGTGHDANGFDQFNAVGMIVGARTSPAAVDFDNFHVEAAQAAEQTASSGTTTSLESEDVLPAETFEAQQVLSDRSAFRDSLSLRELRALDELQALLYTDSGITPEEAQRARELVAILKSD
jgi:hypothetical protein